MLNNRHWLSDVLAGAGIGMLSTKVVYLAYPWAHRKITGRAPDKFGVVPVYRRGAVGIVAVWVLPGVSRKFGRRHVG
jgi:membrane-associated phospholipid phosphatase